MTWRNGFALGCAEAGISVDGNVAGASLTTWRVGGPIAAVASVATMADLLVLAAHLPRDVDVRAIGRGSNLLVADEGFDGVVVRLTGDFEAIGFASDGTVTAGGAVSLPVLARRAAAAGCGGLEFFVGIPGSVGGAVRMNAGGHGSETKDVLEQVTLVHLDNAVVEARANAACAFAYRSSNIGDRSIVVEANFSTRPADPAVCSDQLDEIVAWRRAHQPGGANAGSVFTNPLGASAGQLIDAAGCKGLAVGGASISEKHANFIQTRSGATALDVVDLIALVRSRVLDHAGIELHPEVHRLGFGNPQQTDRNMRS